jgi:tRNA C32,U32 (ribose-2'-O)-methylase TrmJ
VAYELSQKTYKAAFPEFVTHEAVEDLYRHIQATLQLLDYAPRGDSDLEKTIMRNLKHLIGRAGLTEWELKMVHGLCTQVEKRINPDSPSKKSKTSLVPHKRDVRIILEEKN